VELNRLIGHSDAISHISLSSDGTQLVSSSTDGTLGVWALFSGSLRQKLRGHSGAVLHARFCLDDLFIVSFSTDSTIIIWDVTTGKQLHRLHSDDSQFTGVSISPDNVFLAACSTDATIRLWTMPFATEVFSMQEAHQGPIHSVTFSSNGKRLLTTSSDGTMKVWSIDGTLHKILRGHNHVAHSAAFSKDMSSVVSASRDGTIWIWDLSADCIESTAHTGVVIQTVGFSECGRYIQTDRGTLARPSMATNLASRGPPKTFVAEEWIKRGESEALWLPKEHHATAVATCEDLCVLGHASGGISLIEFRSFLSLT